MTKTKDKSLRFLTKQNHEICLYLKKCNGDITVTDQCEFVSPASHHHKENLEALDVENTVIKNIH